MEINQVPLTTASSNQFGHTVNFGSNASNNSSNERYHRITVILINKVKLCRRQISKNQFIRVQHYSSGCISCSVNLQFFIAIHTSEILIWSLINVLSFSSSYTGLKSNNFKYLHHQRFCKGKHFQKNCGKKFYFTNMGEKSNGALSKKFNLLCAVVISKKYQQVQALFPQ